MDEPPRGVHELERELSLNAGQKAPLDQHEARTVECRTVFDGQRNRGKRAVAAGRLLLLAVKVEYVQERPINWFSTSFETTARLGPSLGA